MLSVRPGSEPHPLREPCPCQVQRQEVDTQARPGACRTWTQRPWPQALHPQLGGGDRVYLLCHGSPGSKYLDGLCTETSRFLRPPEAAACPSSGTLRDGRSPCVGVTLPWQVTVPSTRRHRPRQLADDCHRISGPSGLRNSPGPGGSGQHSGTAQADAGRRCFLTFRGWRFLLWSRLRSCAPSLAAVHLEKRFESVHRTHGGSRYHGVREVAGVCPGAAQF